MEWVSEVVVFVGCLKEAEIDAMLAMERVLVRGSSVIVYCINRTFLLRRSSKVASRQMA